MAPRTLWVKYHCQKHACSGDAEQHLANEPDWQILAWSKLGSSEKYNNIHQIVFSLPQLVGCNLASLWLEGVTFSALVSIGVGTELILAVLVAHFFGWIISFLIVPSLA